MITQHQGCCDVYIPGGIQGRNDADDRCHACHHPRRDHTAEVVESWGNGLAVHAQIVTPSPYSRGEAS